PPLQEMLPPCRAGSIELLTPFITKVNGVPSLPLVGSSLGRPSAPPSAGSAIAKTPTATSTVRPGVRMRESIDFVSMKISLVLRPGSSDPQAFVGAYGQHRSHRCGRPPIVETVMEGNE